jgi:hypothetical protein
MDSQIVVIILRLLHISFGMFWVGSALTTSFLTLPTVRATGPVGGQFFGEFMRRNRYSNLMLVAGLVTIASGLALYWDFYVGLAWSLSRPGPETIFGLGGLVAIVVAVAANTMIPSVSKKLAEIGRSIQAAGGNGGMPASELLAERGRLSLRLARIGMANAALLVVAGALMAVGRYV